jgi:hypothetical protein
MGVIIFAMFWHNVLSTITMCIKLMENFTNPSILINLIDDYFGIAFELFLLASNIKRKVCGVLDFFLSF